MTWQGIGKLNFTVACPHCIKPMTAADVAAAERAASIRGGGSAIVSPSTTKGRIVEYAGRYVYILLLIALSPLDLSLSLLAL